MFFSCPLGRNKVIDCLSDIPLCKLIPNPISTGALGLGIAVWQLRTTTHKKDNLDSLKQLEFERGYGNFWPSGFPKGVFVPIIF